MFEDFEAMHKTVRDEAGWEPENPGPLREWNESETGSLFHKNLIDQDIYVFQSQRGALDVNYVAMGDASRPGSETSFVILPLRRFLLQ
jgi:hypothetical protein